MSRNLALFLAGAILLIVALTMGEDGVVTQIAGMDAQDAQRVQQAYRSDDAAEEATGKAGRNPWAASGSTSEPASQASPAKPVFHPEPEPIAPQPAVIDPAIVAKSEIN